MQLSCSRLQAVGVRRKQMSEKIHKSALPVPTPFLLNLKYPYITLLSPDRDGNDDKEITKTDKNQVIILKINVVSDIS